MDSSKKSKKPSRVQGAWGGGGGGGGLHQPRNSGTIGQRRISEKHASANFVPHSSQNSDNRTTGSAVSCKKGEDETANNSNTSNSNAKSNTSNSNFVFHQPTDRELFRKPPEIIAIQEGGVHEISTGPTGPATLRLFPQLFDQKDADWIFDDLMKQLPWRQQVNRKEGREEFVEPRLTAWFGHFPYRYSGVIQEPNPWNPIMSMLKDRVEQLTERQFNSCLANYYRNDKDSIGWHSDDEPVLGKFPVIASLSFGDVRVFEMRKRPQPPDERDDYRFSQIVKVPLPHGSLLVMEGAAQEDWQHRVPKEYHDREPRINLTFRTIFPERDARD